MSEFNLKDLESIHNKEEVMDLLIKEGIIKEEKFIAQLNYERELNELQKELIKLQSHIIEKGKRVLIIFEGRDAAGKGGAIKRLSMNLNPKICKTVALSKPTPIESGQWYFQRYLKHLPTKGEMVLFDRSWYNRAVVEPVFGFCNEDQYKLFMKTVDNVERLLIKDGIIFIKFFLSISKDEQKKRLDERKNDPLKKWKLGPLDEKAQEKWEDYSHYIKKMLQKTGKEENPWIEIVTDDKKTARLEIIKYLLNHFLDFKPENDYNTNNKIVKIHS